MQNLWTGGLQFTALAIQGVRFEGYQAAMLAVWNLAPGLWTYVTHRVDRCSEGWRRRRGLVVVEEPSWPSVIINGRSTWQLRLVQLLGLNICQVLPKWPATLFLPPCCHVATHVRVSALYGSVANRNRAMSPLMKQYLNVLTSCSLCPKQRDQSKFPISWKQVDAAKLWTCLCPYLIIICLALP